jgi:hypothetical protein
MTIKIIEFPKGGRDSKINIQKANSAHDEEIRFKCVKLVTAINKILAEKSNILDTHNPEEDLKRLTDLYKLLQCKEFTYDEKHDPLKNNILREPTFLDGLKIIFGIKL